MDIGTWRGVLTLLLFILFVGVCVWTWSRKRDADFERAAQLPLEDDTRPPPTDTDKEHTK